MDKDSQSNYYLINDNKSTSSEKLTHQLNFHEDERDAKTTFSHPQQVSHNYRILNSKLQEIPPSHPNDYRKPLQNHGPSLQPIHPHNNIQFTNGSYQSFNSPRVQVIVHNNVPNPSQISKNNIHASVEGASKFFFTYSDLKSSVMYAQTIPCQRCGLVSEGPLSLEKGRTAWAWGTGLFLFTGLFCFLPCVIDKCKDTWVSCPRCGHKKAVVKSKCCC